MFNYKSIVLVIYFTIFASMKKYIYITTAIIIAALVTTLVIMGISQKNLKEKYRASYANEMAYQRENSELKQANIQFEYTIGQLHFSQDSLVQKLNDTRKELKIKDKQLLAMSYLKTEMSKTDTLYIHSTDTAFIANPINVPVDTVIGDKWINTHLILNPPDQVVLTPSVVSEKEVFTKQSKVVERPSKSKFINFFRKKIKVVEIEVVESNPYIVNKEQRFIKVIK